MPNSTCKHAPSVPYLQSCGLHPGRVVVDDAVVVVRVPVVVVLVLVIVVVLVLVIVVVLVVVVV